MSIHSRLLQVQASVSLNLQLIGSGCFPTGTSLDNNNNLVVTGYTIISGVKNVFVARYLATNGLLDTITNGGTGFGTNGQGFITTLIGTSSQAKSVAIQSLISFYERTPLTGNIIVTGTATISGVSKIFVASYTPVGIVDTTFNTTGYVTSTLTAQGLNVAIKPNNEMIITGSGATLLLYLQPQTGSFFPNPPSQNNAISSRTSYVFSIVNTKLAIDAYGSNSSFLVDYLSLNFYAQIITDPTAQTAALDAVKFILSSFALAYDGTNLLKDLKLVAAQLANAQTDLTWTYYNSITEINSFFTALTNRITSLIAH